MDDGGEGLALIRPDDWIAVRLYIDDFVLIMNGRLENDFPDHFPRRRRR